jgi:hypothetical protein
VNSATEAFAVLARLVLPLGHAVEPAHPRRAVEQPLKFGMGGHLRLVEQDRAIRVDPAGNQRGDHLARVGGEAGGLVRHRDGVEVGQKVEAGCPLAVHSSCIATQLRIAPR